PVKLSDTPGAVGRTAPDLGQHTGEVLTSLLGLAPETLDRLRVEGVIR
ncbi:MAG: CoA transferase, partial [Candidatus Latescibacteria bacterium]|nr:CoA transferase [Candidatus Latescibacterota bacterium]